VIEKGIVPAMFDLTFLVMSICERFCRRFTGPAVLIFGLAAGRPVLGVLR
jgi:hypothetical protein